MYWGAFEGQSKGRRLWYFIFWLVWRRRARKGAGLPSRRIKARIICFPVFYTPPHPHFLKGLLLYFPDESTRPKQRFEGHHGLLWKKRHFEGHKRLLLFGKKELDNIFAIYILTIKTPYTYTYWYYCNQSMLYCLEPLIARMNENVYVSYISIHHNKLSHVISAIFILRNSVMRVPCWQSSYVMYW